MKRIIICGMALANLAVAAPAFARGDIAVMVTESPMSSSTMSEMTQTNKNHSEVMMMIKLDPATMAKFAAKLKGNNLNLTCQDDPADPNAFACYEGGSTGG